LLHIGAGVNWKRTKEALEKFIDGTGIYFFGTQMSMGVVDERYEHFLGTERLDLEPAASPSP